MKNEKAKNLDATFQQLNARALECIKTKIIAFSLFLHELYLLQIQHWRACPTPCFPGSLTKATGTAFAQPVLLQLCHTTLCSTQGSLCSLCFTDLLQQHPWLAAEAVSQLLQHLFSIPAKRKVTAYHQCTWCTVFCNFAAFA